MALRRLQHEWSAINRQTDTAAIRAGPIDETNLYLWWGIISGPAGTPYEGGQFNVIIEFPTEYPFKPPKLKFQTRIFHPNISRKGTVCVDILQRNWSPVLTAENVLLSVTSLLASPNPDDPMDTESANMFQLNRTRYEQTARLWTREYAAQATISHSSSSESASAKSFTKHRLNMPNRHSTESSDQF